MIVGVFFLTQERDQFRAFVNRNFDLHPVVTRYVNGKVKELSVATQFWQVYQYIFINTSTSCWPIRAEICYI